MPGDQADCQGAFGENLDRLDQALASASGGNGAQITRFTELPEYRFRLRVVRSGRLFQILPVLRLVRRTADAKKC